ncbi:MAG: hypothetical protein HOV81_16765 [Kofleriaceae bacterium]|nr:hypothetical protein [Kofleriaceae bacterium]
MKRVVLLCLVLAACKSSLGENCQVNEDCDSNLICSASTNTCQNPGGANPIDASPVPDAPVDAPPDAP